MSLSTKKIHDFQKRIFTWWLKHKRDLPWRHTHDPYKIMVSEVMLQQTQTSRVVPKYTEFLAVFPTLGSLSRASPGAVIRAWKGLGYNRRALYLLKAAKRILECHNGIFPRVEKELAALPGLGTYTARAILVFAYKKDVAMVDTNIRKIITHFFFHDKKQPENVIQDLAQKLLPKGKSWEWHQALMDYSAIELSRKFKVHKVIKSKPFKESNRFFRGRLVDLLREKEYEYEILLEELIKTYEKPKAFFVERIMSLVKDGLAVQRGKDIHLPL
jgi:A/G-specific adenine glycosylase